MKKHYNDPDGSKFPVGSPEYTEWLNGLEPVYHVMMLEEIKERASQIKKENHADE
jgi:hypothetical protein